MKGNQYSVPYHLSEVGRLLDSSKVYFDSSNLPDDSLDITTTEKHKWRLSGLEIVQSARRITKADKRRPIFREGLQAVALPSCLNHLRALFRPSY